MELLHAYDRKKGSYREEWWSYCMQMTERRELQRRVVELLYADDRKKGSYREEWWSYCMQMIERRGVTEKSGGATACR